MRVRGMGNTAWSAYRSARVVRNATQDNTKNNQDVVGPVIGNPVPSVCSFAVYGRSGLLPRPTPLIFAADAACPTFLGADHPRSQPGNYRRLYLTSFRTIPRASLSRQTSGHVREGAYGHVTQVQAKQSTSRDRVNKSIQRIAWRCQHPKRKRQVQYRHSARRFLLHLTPTQMGDITSARRSVINPELCPMMTITY